MALCVYVDIAMSGNYRTNNNTVGIPDNKKKSMGLRITFLSEMNNPPTFLKCQNFVFWDSLGLRIRF